MAERLRAGQQPLAVANKNGRLANEAPSLLHHLGGIAHLRGERRDPLCE